MPKLNKDKIKKRSALRDFTNFRGFRQSLFAIDFYKFHSLQLFTEKKQAIQKKFEVTQFWVATYKLRTIGVQDLSGMGNPLRRIDSTASTTLQVINAHQLFHLDWVIVYGKAIL